MSNELKLRREVDSLTNTLGMMIEQNDKLRSIIEIYEIALKKIAKDKVEFFSAEIAKEALEKGRAK